ncbi:MAG TPA: UDPGP type 1 family protein [Planctomycetaceae bacterium]|nr:UDPGP type 1 family protein [Planctomycetaceae bacterium]
MTSDSLQALRQTLESFQQEHLLEHLDSLPADRKAAFVAQLQSVDFGLVDCLWQQRHQQAESETPAERAKRAHPPENLVRLPRSDADHAAFRKNANAGEELLRNGRVAVILVAGGQGTRLSFPQPKGMFPIGPVSGKSLFQIFAEQIEARQRRAGAIIPWYIMTSDATHDETVAFFESQHYFRLSPEAVRFFRQGTMPALDAHTGQLLLAGPGELALSPDGHGGLLEALRRADLFADMRRRGIEHLYYHQVDNPLAVVCDPTFLGLHLERRAEVSTKVVSKTSAEEKMGVLVSVDGRTQIIEYSDLPAEIANRRTASGDLEIWAGSTAIHVFERAFLERIAEDAHGLPFHVALKKVPYLDATCHVAEPDKPNAWKFERFIFDVLLVAERALVVETDRATEFNPLKNSEGAHSPEDVRQRMSQLYARWLREAGRDVPDGTPVEISPLFALDAPECAARLGDRDLGSGPIYVAD